MVTTPAPTATTTDGVDRTTVRRPELRYGEPSLECAAASTGPAQTSTGPAPRGGPGARHVGPGRHRNSLCTQLDPVRGELSMPVGRHCGELLVAEGVGIGRAPLAHRHQGEVEDAPAAQPLQVGGARLLEDGDLKPREAAPHRAKSARQLPCAETHPHRDDQLARQLTGAGSRRRPGPPRRAHRDLRLPQERAADHSEHESGRPAGEHSTPSSRSRPRICWDTDG